MTCEQRPLLDADVASAAHHLQWKIKEENDPEQEAFALGEIKRTAQDLLDALELLWQHQREHHCDS